MARRGLGPRMSNSTAAANSSDVPDVGTSVVGASAVSGTLGSNTGWMYRAVCTDEGENSMLCHGLKFAMSLQVLLVIIFAVLMAYFVGIFLWNGGLIRITDYARHFAIMKKRN